MYRCDDCKHEWDVPKYIGDVEERQCPKCESYNITFITDRELALVKECKQYKEALRKILSMSTAGGWIEFTLQKLYPDVLNKLKEK